MMISNQTKLLLIGAALGTVGLAALKGAYATFVAGPPPAPSK